MRKGCKNLMKSLLVLCFFIGFSIICYAESKKDVDWQYVVTRSGITYSVDMSSVSFHGAVMVFRAALDKPQDEIITIVSMAVDASKKEFRFEESFLFDRTTKEFLASSLEPTEWTPIGKNSPIEMMVNFILRNHPDTKNFKP